MFDIVLIDIPVLRTKLPDTLYKVFRQNLIAKDMIYRKCFTEKLILREKIQFSRGLLCLATYLKKSGFSVKYLNQSEEIDMFAIIEATSQSRFVAFSAMTLMVPTILTICENIKKENKAIVSIIGGPHATFADIDLINSKFVDIVVRGSGENSLHQIVESYPLIGQINGITYREPVSNHIIHNDDHSRPFQIDISLPEYLLLPRNLTDYKINIYSSIGCSSRCSFCLDWKLRPNQKYRGIDEVIAELCWLSSILPKGEVIQFFDSNISANPLLLENLCDAIIKEDLSFYYVCDISPGSLTPNIIRKMDRCGFIGIKLGFEADADNIQQLIHKMSSYSQYVETAELIHRHSDILVTAYWLSNLPGTTSSGLNNAKKVIHELLEKKIIDFLSHKLFVPYPGTSVFLSPSKFGGHIISNDWSKFDRLYPDPVFVNHNMNNYDWLHYMIDVEDIALSYYLSRLQLTCHELQQVPGPSSYKRCYVE